MSEEYESVHKIQISFKQSSDISYRLHVSARTSHDS